MYQLRANRFSTPAFSIVLIGILATFASVVTRVAPATAGALSTATAPSGENMPVGDLPGWKQIFTDDFTTNVPLGSFPAAVSSKWGAYLSPWKDTSGNGTYSPGVVSVSGGLINSDIHTTNGVSMVTAFSAIVYSVWFCLTGGGRGFGDPSQ